MVKVPTVLVLAYSTTLVVGVICCILIHEIVSAAAKATIAKYCCVRDIQLGRRTWQLTLKLISFFFYSR